VKLTTGPEHPDLCTIRAVYCAQRQLAMLGMPSIHAARASKNAQRARDRTRMPWPCAGKVTPLQAAYLFRMDIAQR